LCSEDFLPTRGCFFQSSFVGGSARPASGNEVADRVARRGFRAFLSHRREADVACGNDRQRKSELAEVDQWSLFAKFAVEEMYGVCLAENRYRGFSVSQIDLAGKRCMNNDGQQRTVFP
jgi:hypothetical protein